MARPVVSKKSKTLSAQTEKTARHKTHCQNSSWESDCSCKFASSGLELPKDRLALTVRKTREASGKSIYRLADDSGVDGSSIWRIENGERRELTRETLMLLSLGMVLNRNQVEQVIEAANEILDAAGLKMLRPPWEVKSK